MRGIPTTRRHGEKSAAARDFFRQHPSATAAECASACDVSRSVAYTAKREIVDGIQRPKSKRRKTRLDNFRWRKPDARLVRAAAELCREIRHRLGFTQEELAERTGMMLVADVNAESGAAATSRMDRYSRVAEYLRDVGGDPGLVERHGAVAADC